MDDRVPVSGLVAHRPADAEGSLLDIAQVPCSQEPVEGVIEGRGKGPGPFGVAYVVALCPVAAQGASYGRMAIARKSHHLKGLAGLDPAPGCAGGRPRR